jgi:hypothetical protein
MIPRLSRFTISLQAEVQDFTEKGAERLTFERISASDSRVDNHQLWKGQLAWIGEGECIELELFLVLTDLRLQKTWAASPKVNGRREVLPTEGPAPVQWVTEVGINPGPQSRR